MTLDARVVRRLGSLALEVELHTGPGEVVAVLGPNGAGKTTLLRALAGLLDLDDGSVALDGRVLDDPVAGTFVPAERRPVGVVFQDYLLFAHLSARDNVAFGLRARGMGRAPARRRAEELLERVGLTGAVVATRPRALSGGQQQRVALARALAGEPRLLLLDEPLAALDAGTRAEVRRELRTHLAGFAGVCLVVTHDPLDAYALAERVVVVEGGRTSQSGTLAEVAGRPRTPYVADLVGTNLYSGTSRGHDVTTASGAHLVAAGSVDGPAFVAIAPRSVALYRSPPDGSPRNVWPGTVVDVDRRPDGARVRIDGPVPVVAEVAVATVDSMGLRPGQQLWAVVKAAEVTSYPA